MKKMFIIHGWTYTTDKWQEFNRLITQAGFEPVQLTVPGLTEESNKVWTLDEYVEWLNKKLSEEDKPIVVGHSNGGRIALAFAAKYSEKLGKLILIDSAGIYHNEFSLRLKRAVFGAAAKIGKKLTTSGFLKKAFYKLAGESDYNRASETMKQTMVNLISVDLTPKLSTISVPTLIIWGDEDTATPLADGKLMNERIKNSQLYIINNAGHSPHFSHAKEVVEKILQA